MDHGYISETLESIGDHDNTRATNSVDSSLDLYFILTRKQAVGTELIRQNFIQTILPVYPTSGGSNTFFKKKKD